MTKEIKKIFKVEAEGDTLYIQAPTLDEAKIVFVDKIGNVPIRLKWSEVAELPEGEDFL